jgi:hypothetical protein
MNLLPALLTKSGLKTLVRVTSSLGIKDKKVTAQAFRCSVNARHYAVVYANTEEEAIEQIGKLLPTMKPAPRRLPWLDDQFEVGHLDVYDRQITLGAAR